MKKFTEYLAGKSIRQRILLAVGAALLIIFLFFVVKGNVGSFAPAPDESTAETAESAEEVPAPTLHVGIIDIIPLAAVSAGYGIHKLREKKRERRK